MNVLVYSGPEIAQNSLNGVLSALRVVLLPHYTVQPITHQALTTQPWQSSCALLVLPRSKQRVGSSITTPIVKFVEEGGKYLAIGTSASATLRSGGIGSGLTTLNFGQDAEEAPFRFFDRVANAYITFEEAPNVESGVTSLKTSDGTVVDGLHDTGATLIGFSDLKNASIHATRPDGSAAAVIAGASKGRISLWGPDVADAASHKLLISTLTGLGLQIPQDPSTNARPTAQFLTGNPSKVDIVARITAAIAAPRPGDQLTSFKDANDEFRFHVYEESASVLEASRVGSTDPATWQPKGVIVYPDGKLPPRALTPLFDVELFYDALEAARGATAASFSPWGLGDALMYGEVVTSTQTMLDKNPVFLRQLPTPLLSLASYQLAGRGRGSNVWLSPSGCLQFSIVLRVGLDSLPPSKLVFLQYLFALSVVEACSDESVLGPKAGAHVRLKWPNDIYTSVGANGKDDLRKIGGVLVNTSFQGGQVDIVIGCGVNVLNLPPMTSLSQLSPASRAPLSMEKTTAAIMARFGSMWSTFLEKKGSFEPFLDLYLRRWLHSDQLVTLTTTTPHTAVRIVGITTDYGLLRTVPDRMGMRRSGGDDEDYIDLQPDGNSFDLMANLIKSKS
ncbi:hypothetical protein D9619_009794 [Psilocybe cf. subviscida]|uniref:BPL/LPL catalytic domain-containing protein n=1 Tax=Psilocybe cf. subviscida TaxID=2480587 RepID=A0A8H5BKP6_9AGAR|nr:hypothetical protein D9619_009794 [Psilocybe cf. subviscida]